MRSVVNKRIKPVGIIAVAIAALNILYTVFRAIITGSNLTVFDIWSIAGCVVFGGGLMLALVLSAKRERNKQSEEPKEEQDVE